MYSRVATRDTDELRRASRLNIMFSQHTLAVETLMQRIRSTCGLGDPDARQVDARPLGRAMLRAAIDATGDLPDPTVAEHVWCGTYLASPPEVVRPINRPRFAIHDGDFQLCVSFAAIADLPRLAPRGCRVVAEEGLPITNLTSALRRRDEVNHCLEFDLQAVPPTVVEREGRERRFEADPTDADAEEDIVERFMRIPVSVRLAIDQKRVTFDNRVAVPHRVFEEGVLRIDRSTRFERTRFPRSSDALGVMGVTTTKDEGRLAGTLMRPRDSGSVRPVDWENIVHSVASVDPRITPEMARRALRSVPMHPFSELAMVRKTDVDEDREGARSLYLLARVVQFAEQIEFRALSFDALLDAVFRQPAVAVSIIREAARVFPHPVVAARLRRLAELEARLHDFRTSLRAPAHDAQIDDVLDSAASDIGRLARAVKDENRELIRDGSGLDDVERAVRDREDRLATARAELRRTVRRFARAERRAAKEERMTLHRMEQRLSAVRDEAKGNPNRACHVEAPRLVDEVAAMLKQVADSETRRGVAIEYVQQACKVLDDRRMPAPECFARSSKTISQAAEEVLTLLS